MRNSTASLCLDGVVLAVFLCSFFYYFSTSIQQLFSCQYAIPSAVRFDAFGCTLEDVNVVPDFIRRFAIKVIVWPDMIVVKNKFLQVNVKLLAVLNNDLAYLVFEGANKAFDSAVLPRTRHVTALVADAQ